MPRDKEELVEPSASWRGRGEHGETGASDRSGGAEPHGASAKRQRTLRQMFLSSGSGQVGGKHGQAGASEHGGGEHDEAGAPHDDGSERVESGAAERCDGIKV